MISELIFCLPSLQLKISLLLADFSGDRETFNGQVSKQPASRFRDKETVSREPGGCLSTLW